MSPGTAVTLNFVFTTIGLGVLTAVVCLHLRLSTKQAALSTSAERLRQKLQNGPHATNATARPLADATGKSAAE